MYFLILMTEWHSLGKFLKKRDSFWLTVLEVQEAASGDGLLSGRGLAGAGQHLGSMCISLLVPLPLLMKSAGFDSVGFAQMTSCNPNPLSMAPPLKAIVRLGFYFLMPHSWDKFQHLKLRRHLQIIVTAFILRNNNFNVCFH